MCCLNHAQVGTKYLLVVLLRARETTMNISFNRFRLSASTMAMKIKHMHLMLLALCCLANADLQAQAQEYQLKAVDNATPRLNPTGVLTSGALSIAISPNGNYIFVAQNKTSNISVVDAK